MAEIFPKDVRRGIHAFVTLSEEERKALLGAAASLKPTLDQEVVAETIADVLPTVPSSTVHSIIHSLIDLHGYVARRATDQQELCEDLHEALVGDPERPLENLSQQAFADMMAVALEPGSPLGVIGKATDLQLDSDRVFGAARVITDVRPVFGNDITVEPSTMVIFHALKIRCYESGVRKEYFFTLDDGDLASLRDAIARAMRKSETLRHMFSGQNKTCLGA